jgi:hypothetical protein
VRAANGRACRWWPAHSHGERIMSQEPDGSSYLAALKRGTAAAAAAAPARIGGAAAPGPDIAATPAAPGPAGTEKRRSPRYKCQGSAEICEEGSEVRIWATCTDISMHGCYVEASTVYPPGTMLLIRIDAQNIRIQAQGNVRVSYPHLGMGIAFTFMAEQDRTRLKEMLRTFTRPSTTIGGRHSL